MTQTPRSTAFKTSSLLRGAAKPDDQRSLKILASGHLEVQDPSQAGGGQCPGMYFSGCSLKATQKHPQNTGGVLGGARDGGREAGDEYAPGSRLVYDGAMVGRVERVLGRGAFGTVHRFRDVASGETLAMKALARAGVL